MDTNPLEAGLGMFIHLDKVGLYIILQLALYLLF